jgi:hypothetical protein
MSTVKLPFEDIFKDPKSRQHIKGLSETDVFHLTITAAYALIVESAHVISSHVNLTVPAVV